ncbi:SpoIIE family protein phosphatase [Verrucomicrobiota bacterium sgz303538]
MLPPEPNPENVDSIHLLLIESDTANVARLREMLKDAPVRFEVEHADRLSEALRRLDQGGIDLILADLSLQDSHGMETFRRLSEHSAQVPVIVLSDLADESVALATVKRGAQDYLVKGQVDKPLLVKSIRYAIKRAEADRELAAERNLLRAVIDNLVDAVYVKNREGEYLLGNNAHARQLGLRSPEEVVGKKTSDLFPDVIARGFRTDDEEVMTTGQAIINRHERVDEANRPTRWLSTTKVPLRDTEGQIVGVVGIGRDITARKQAEEQVARYTRELQEKNAEMADELEMAREVQQAFLPQQFPTFPLGVPPEKSAISFYSTYLPTNALGGDFFHVIPVSDTKAGVLICDVMGHGVRAALVTAIQRALVEELTAYADKPGEFLTRMNESLLAILRRTRSPMFASAFYVVIDVETGHLCYANAGHPRPLHVRRSKNDVVLLDGPGERPGAALGVFDASHYAQQEAQMEPRDLLLLFTDGLYEVENARGEFYDQDLLLKSTERRIQRPTEEVIDETLEEVRQFSVTRNFIDDVCLIGAEFLRFATGAENAGGAEEK